MRFELFLSRTYSSMLALYIDSRRLIAIDAVIHASIYKGGFLASGSASILKIKARRFDIAVSISSRSQDQLLYMVAYTDKWWSQEHTL